MWIILGAVVGFGAWALLVAYGNLNAYPAPSQEPNDYGEKHRMS